MKKIMASILMVSASALVLGACGNENSKSDSDSAVEKMQTIKSGFSNSDVKDFQKLSEDVVNKFASYKDTDVLIQVGNYKLLKKDVANYTLSTQMYPTEILNQVNVLKYINHANISEKEWDKQLETVAKQNGQGSTNNLIINSSQELSLKYQYAYNKIFEKELNVTDKKLKSYYEKNYGDKGYDTMNKDMLKNEYISTHSTEKVLAKINKDVDKTKVTYSKEFSFLKDYANLATQAPTDKKGATKDNTAELNKKAAEAFSKAKPSDVIITVGDTKLTYGDLQVSTFNSSVAPAFLDVLHNKVITELYPVSKEEVQKNIPVYKKTYGIDASKDENAMNNIKYNLSLEKAILDKGLVKEKDIETLYKQYEANAKESKTDIVSLEEMKTSLINELLTKDKKNISDTTYLLLKDNNKVKYIDDDFKDYVLFFSRL